MNKKNIIEILLKLVIIIVGIYIALVFVLFLNQKSMLYFPDKSNFYECKNFEKNEIKTYNGTRFYEKKGKKDDVIIYFHGNAGNACMRTEIKSLLEKTGENFIFVEYNGYGESKSKPNIKDILKDADNIGSYVKSKNYNKILVLGVSLGTGVGSYFAGKNNVEKLVLISPYSELMKIAQEQYSIFPIKYIFTQDYNSIEYLKNYKNKILILHGTNDDIIPIKFGKELYDSLITKDKEFIEVKNGTHHNIFDFDKSSLKVLKFYE